MTDLLTSLEVEGMGEWLTMIASHVGPYNAGIALDWSPKQVRKLLADPHVQEAIAVAREMGIETIEEKAYDLAKAGNVPMIQMILYCHGADRGWKPPTQRVAVNHGGTVHVERVQAVSSAVREHLERHGVEMLAIDSPLDEDDDIEEAEIVDADQ